MQKTLIAAGLIILVLFGVSFYFYPVLPAQMASHWDINGEVNGYLAKDFALFLVPVLAAFLCLVFFLIPRLDPLKQNIEEFVNYYYGFIVLLLLFMLLVQMHIILWNIGTKIDVLLTFPLGLGVLFFYIGILLEKTKPNWFIGVRTPWTLSSPSVWKKTHLLAGKLFKASGIISIIGILFPPYSLFFILIPVFITAIWSLVYSYFEYSKEKK